MLTLHSASESAQATRCLVLTKRPALRCEVQRSLVALLAWHRTRQLPRRRCDVSRTDMGNAATRLYGCITTAWHLHTGTQALAPHAAQHNLGRRKSTVEAAGGRRGSVVAGGRRGSVVGGGRRPSMTGSESARAIELPPAYAAVFHALKDALAGLNEHMDDIDEAIRREAKQLFQVLDLDKNGVLTYLELHSALDGLGFVQEEIDMILIRAGLSSDDDSAAHGINFEAFLEGIWPILAPGDASPQDRIHPLASV